MSLESAYSFLPSAFGEVTAIYVVFVLVALEGLSGGLAYVNVFYRLGIDDDADIVQSQHVGTGEAAQAKARREREREFRIASVGFADTLGILTASLVSSVLEPTLCNAQVSRGRTLCKEV